MPGNTSPTHGRKVSEQRNSVPCREDTDGLLEEGAPRRQLKHFHDQIVGADRHVSLAGDCFEGTAFPQSGAEADSLSARMRCVREWRSANSGSIRKTSTGRA